MHALLRTVIKEFLHLRQDRKMVPVLVAGPLIQLLALGYAANLDVTDVPLLLVDQDRTASSRELAERFTGSRYFRLVGAVDTVADVEPWLVAGHAQVALVIASGFGADLAAGRRARVQVLADGTDANSAVLGLGYASRIVGGLRAELVAAQWQRPGGRSGGTVGGPPGGGGAPGLTPPAPGHIALHPRVFYNPDLKSRWFYVPAVLAMVLMLVTMILPSMAVVREKELGTLEQIIVSPLRPWQLIVGKLLPFLLVGLVDALLIALLIEFVFEVPLRGSLLLLLGLTLVFLFTMLGLGLLVSTVVRTQQQAMMSAVFGLMVPMIYLSGLVFPIENMPWVMQLVSYATPVRYYAIVLRGIFLKGSGIDVLWPEALVLLAFGIVVLALAARRFRKKLD